MVQGQYTISWDAYQKNIGTGLASLQQNGEFVDMTLAADGHFVKVHQLIISLASPYLKELIKSAQCPNPVIFLNKVSYTSLCSILEYIYTGEVNVEENNLSDLMEAGKALYIKGLKDINIHSTTDLPETKTSEETFEERCSSSEQQYMDSSNVIDDDDGYRDDEIDIKIDLTHDIGVEDSSKYDPLDQTSELENSVSSKKRNIKKMLNEKDTLQYSLSNQGYLQLVYNRYIYNLRYSNEPDEIGMRRLWRCINYNSMKCRAVIITKGNVVVNSAANVEESDDLRFEEHYNSSELDAEDSAPNIYDSRSTIIKDEPQIDDDDDTKKNISTNVSFKKKKISKDKIEPLQFTLSNQGTIQLVFNRFIYNLRYCKPSVFGMRRSWRCINYNNKRCRAVVITEGNEVTKRKNGHVHPMEDMKIMKKIREANIFSVIEEAQSIGKNMRMARQQQKADSI